MFYLYNEKQVNPLIRDPFYYCCPSILTKYLFNLIIDTLHRKGLNLSRH